MYTKEDIIKFIEESDEIDRQIANTTFGKFYIFGDFNDASKVQQHFKPGSNQYDTSVLEEYDLAWGFSDEYGVCEQCGGLIEYADEDHAVMWGHSTLICGACIRSSDGMVEDYLEELINNSKSANLRILSTDQLREHNCILVKDGYEAGLFSGMTAKPEEILKDALKKEPNGEFFFSVDSHGPFATEFSLWKRVSA